MNVGESRKIVFFGSPPAAVVVLEALISGGHEVVGAVTQPPRRRSRGGGASPTAVEQCADLHGVPVVHAPAEAEAWCDAADIGVVVAYGRLIPGRLLARCRMLNVHFSLLPRWRGAAPVERAILAGDAETGVSIMEVEETLDTGAVLAVRRTPIGEDDSTESLTMRLAVIGADAMLGVLAAGDRPGAPQVGDASYANKIDAEERIIDWSDDASAIRRRVRALEAWCWCGDRRLGVRSCDATDVDLPGRPAPGTVFPDGTVATGNGTVFLRRVTPEGRREMEATEWLTGLRASGPVILSRIKSVR